MQSLTDLLSASSYTYCALDSWSPRLMRLWRQGLESFLNCSRVQGSAAHCINNRASRRDTRIAASAQISEPSPTSSQVQVRLPLSERPYSYAAKLQDLHAWYEQARQQTISRAETFCELDDPSGEDLQVLVPSLPTYIQPLSIIPTTCKCLSACSTSQVSQGSPISTQKPLNMPERRSDQSCKVFVSVEGTELATRGCMWWIMEAAWSFTEAS